MKEISYILALPSVFKCDYALLARRIEFVIVGGGTLMAFSSTAARNGSRAEEMTSTIGGISDVF
jgi:uridylate kinase